MSFKRISSFLSFHSPIFHLKIHKRCGTFFEKMGGGGVLTHESRRTLRGGWGTHKTNIDKQGGIRNLKLNVPKLNVPASQEINHIINLEKRIASELKLLKQEEIFF